MLWRIDAESLTADKALPLGTGCAALSLSQAGLVLALPALNAVWVLDPDSLRPLRVIGGLRAHAVTGSPRTSIGFAAGVPLLVMLDLAVGKALHSFKDKYGAALYAVNGQTIFRAGLRTLRISDDGRFL